MSDLREDLREQTPPQLLDNAPAIWAMLAAVGWNLAAHSYSIEELIRDRYASLAESPGSDYSTSGRVQLRRVWDGDEFVGLQLALDVTTIWAENLPDDFPPGISPWAENSPVSQGRGD